MMPHERFMRLALDLAQRGAGDTSPNPLVGAVVVRNGRIVGQGYHHRAGLPHAEIEALRQAGAKARGAILYVSLEPCTHTGRTPPCCETVIRAGITTVIVAMKDPNPLTNGRGMRRLRQAGIAVRNGVLHAEAQRLNAPFVKYMTRKMPWVVAKIAQSLDGKIATRTGQSQWISSGEARGYAHQLRRQADAVVVGINTILRDNPRLSARASRPVRPGHPLRVIVDSRLRMPPSSRCLKTASPGQVIIATTVRSARSHARFVRRGAVVIALAPRQGRVPLARLFRLLAQRYHVTSLLLEGGGELLAGALAERLVDRIAWVVAPIIVGGRRSPSSVAGEGIARLAQAIRLTGMTMKRLGPDVLIEADIRYPAR